MVWKIFGGGRQVNAVDRKDPPAPKRRPIHARGYDAAKMGRLVADWPTMELSTDEEIRRSLKAIRGRSIDLSHNNDYIKQFLRILPTNVLGAKGLSLVMKAKDDQGEIDKDLNDRIEADFRDWGKKYCSVNGRGNWAGIQKRVVRQTARDGEVFVRLVKNFNNPYRFALQVIRASACDEQLNINEAGRNQIRLGVEVDQWGKAVAYHFMTKPGRAGSYAARGRHYQRIPADQILHIFDLDDSDQIRGIPWAHTAMRRLKMLAGYEEAQVVGARAAAQKVGIWRQTDPQAGTLPGGYNPNGDADEGGQGDYDDDPGEFHEDGQAGEFLIAPAGYTLDAFDPQYPHQVFPEFLKAMMLGASAGVGLSKPTLSGDLSDVNLSTMRLGIQAERDHAGEIKTYMEGAFHDQVVSAWLDMQELTGRVDVMDRARIDAGIGWPERVWPYMDPVKEVTADEKAVKLGFKSRHQICRERGVDFADIVDEQAREIEMMKAAGMPLDDGPNPPLPPPADEDQDDDENKPTPPKRGFLVEN